MPGNFKQIQIIPQKFLQTNLGSKSKFQNQMTDPIHSKVQKHTNITQKTSYTLLKQHIVPNHLVT